MTNACTSYNNKAQDTASKELELLLPEKEGFKWVYNGFAEYGHDMKLDSIDKSNNKITYVITGTVADMSDGESGFPESHFDIALKYIIENGTLTQTKTEQAMMDSEFDKLELIKLPLETGNTWTQNVLDKNGESREIKSEIVNISEAKGIKTYTVLYKDMSDSYYEKRDIREGYGTISFFKEWKDQDGNAYEIGYFIYEEMSGY